MRWSCTHLQSVCFEPKAHNRLCTTLNRALGSVVTRGRSALKQFPCPSDHSGTFAGYFELNVRWSCTHLQSVCFEPKAHDRLCTTLNTALGLVVSRGRSALKHFPCPLDHSGTACWLLRVESCVLELHTSFKVCVSSPKPTTDCARPSV